MAPKSKVAIAVGLTVVLLAGSVAAQEPPPPPPPPEQGAAPPPPQYGTPPPPPQQRPRRYRARVVFNLSFPLMIQAELAVGRWLTLMAGIGGFAIRAGNDGDGFYWLDTMLGLNIHFIGTAPGGWWFGLRSHNGWMGLTQDDDNIYIGAAKALLGYTWIWRSHFSLSLGLGIQYFYVGLRDDGADDKVFIEGVWPAGELTLGVAF